jgi:hypothetical protein
MTSQGGDIIDFITMVEVTVWPTGMIMTGTHTIPISSPLRLDGHIFG